MHQDKLEKTWKVNDEKKIGPWKAQNIIYRNFSSLKKCTWGGTVINSHILRV